METEVLNREIASVRSKRIEARTDTVQFLPALQFAIDAEHALLDEMLTWRRPVVDSQASRAGNFFQARTFENDGQSDS